MGSRSRRRERERLAALGPPVHINVIAPVDLAGLADLIKPAVLYADRVTIYSPTAALLHGVTQFGDLTHPADQLVAIVELASLVPSALPLDFQPDAVAGIEAYLRMSPTQRQQFRRMSGGRANFDELDAMVDGIRRMWEVDMPRVVEQIIESTRAGDLIGAIRAGAVEVAPLADRSPTDHVAGTVAAATTPRGERVPDPAFDGFLETVIDLVSGVDGFPLLDSDACGLVQSMERESVVLFSDSAATRSSEVDAASRFMAFLPSFPQMRLNEVLDLRKTIDGPLVRFRAEMVRLAQDFSRPTDDSFVAEVEDAWRHHVEPALAEIRESLAEHGLLREVASIARGDARRIFTDAGAVVAASHTNLVNLSAMVTMGAAAALPALDVVGRAVNGRMEARADARRQGFYFLHKVDEASWR